MQKMNDPPKRKCERCSGKLQKVISASGIVFKGSGWYVTDYSKKLKAKEEAKPKEESKSPKGDKSPAATAAAPTKDTKRKDPSSSS